MRTIALVIIALLFVSCSSRSREVDSTGRLLNLQKDVGENGMQIFYLEIVTKDVDTVCAVYAAANGLKFGDADVALGNARTAPLSGGGLVGVRAPLRESEMPVVRPYWLVKDIKSAVAAAESAGAKVALPPMEISGHGTCAIYFEGGVEHGLWQR
jgi:uncharacterized protein